MTKLSVVCVVAGIIMILARGPMIFAPQKIINAFKRFVESDFRTRILGVFVLAMGLAMIYASLGVTHTWAYVIMTLGSIIVFAAVFFLLIFPSMYRDVAGMIFELDMAVFRFIGVLGVALGALFIYLGLVTFR